MFGGIKVNGNWRERERERYDEELMQLFRDLYILSFVRIRLLNWIGQVNIMDSKRKVIQVFKNNPQGGRLRGRPLNRWWNCVQRDISKCKVKNWREVKKNRAD